MTVNQMEKIDWKRKQWLTGAETELEELLREIERFQEFKVCNKYLNKWGLSENKILLHGQVKWFVDMFLQIMIGHQYIIFTFLWSHKI